MNRRILVSVIVAASAASAVAQPTRSGFPVRLEVTGEGALERHKRSCEETLAPRAPVTSGFGPAQVIDGPR